MKRSLQTILAIALAFLVATQAAAQETAHSRRAHDGELVIVTMRDGMQITGDVGQWVGNKGFYIKPPDSTARLVRVSDVRSIRSAVDGSALGLPDRTAALSRGQKIAIAVAAASVILALIGHGLGQT